MKARPSILLISADQQRGDSGDGGLYDLAKDPHETRNLFHAPEAAKTRRHLESLLAARPDDMREIQIPVGRA